MGSNFYGGGVGAMWGVGAEVIADKDYFWASSLFWDVTISIFLVCLMFLIF